ncbi:MAG: universal stress protein [Bacteroidota bacterium]|jgi:nucleotide-binding universal stress UspA family protein
MSTTKKNTMLIPVDFSPISIRALDHAVQLARHFDNNLALLHVIEEAFFSSLFSFWQDEEKKKDIKAELRQKMEALADDIKKKHAIECTVVIKEGKISKEIAETATELGCDSIIMGSSGASGLEQLIGSNASKTIMQAGVPVVVVKSDREVNAYKDIVFPLDLTMESRQKVKWAIYLAKSYKATIHIITYQINDEDENIRMRAALKQITRMLEQNGVSYTEKILSKIETDFALDTIAYAESIQADLIMIMSQQENSGLEDFIIGTEAQQLVNKSQNIPVMCIKPGKTGFTSEFAV